MFLYFLCVNLIFFCMHYIAVKQIIFTLQRNIKCICTRFETTVNRIGGVMVSGVLDPRSGQTKDYTIGICCFSAKHAALRRKSKYWLARNQDNVSQWGDMTIVSVRQYYENPTKCVGLIESGPHHHLIENYLVLAMIQLEN